MTTAIRLSGIDKRFGSVHANRAIDLTVNRGSIHGIIGENGAGKSTLMSILYGFYTADAGEIFVGDKPVTIPDSQAAIALGIGMVHQHFMLVETFTVLENIMLGVEGGSLLKRGVERVRSELLTLARDYGLEIDPDALVVDLPVGLQQRVEILKALYRGADILILDEPTGVLTPSEADHLFRILDKLRQEGKTVLLITHKLREIMAVTDRVSVMRQGAMVATLKTEETRIDDLAELMVGRRVLLQVDKKPAEPGEILLSVEDVTVTDQRGVTLLDHISFSVRAGEIVGIAGVSGNGQSELLDVLSGIRSASAGRLSVLGQTIDPTQQADPALMRRLGVAHVPEDRHKMGLVTAFSAEENAILGYHDDEALSSGFLLDRSAVRARVMTVIEGFDIRPPVPDLKAANFSGGNQQKIVLAREIDQDPGLLLVGQPTRGVDIGAIEFIHKRLIALRDAGKAIVLVSVELDEIRALADRVLVMCAGEIVGERPPETDERELGLMMAGIGSARLEEASSSQVVSL